LIDSCISFCLFIGGVCSLGAGVFSRAPALCDRARRPPATRFGEGAPQQELDLRIGTP
jgi:hypothetical protein